MAAFARVSCISCVRIRRTNDRRWQAGGRQHGDGIHGAVNAPDSLYLEVLDGAALTALRGVRDGIREAQGVQEAVRGAVRVQDHWNFANQSFLSSLDLSFVSQSQFRAQTTKIR